MPIICSPLDINANVPAIYSAGDNLHGQLGLGYSSNNPTIVNPYPSTAWKSVSFGFRHALGVKQDGSLWGWGNNAYGELGYGVAESVTYDAPIRIGTDNDWKFVACAWGSSYAIKEDGTLWSCGYNNLGQLGRNSTTNSPTFAKVGSVNTWTHVATSANSTHVVALRSNGSIWVAGDNTSGQLGKGNTTSPNSTFTQIATGNTWTSIAVNNRNTYAVRSDGALYSCGSNSSGLLGKGTTSSSATSDYSLARVGTASDWNVVSASDNWVIAMTTTGTLWSWGSGTDGKLGHGNTTNYYAPTRIGSSSGWKSIAASNLSGAAVAADGTLFTWGSNLNGQLGNGTNNVSTANVPTMVPTSSPVKSVRPAATSYAAITEDNTLIAWGDRQYGFLGDKKEQRVNNFNQVLDIGGNVAQMSASSVFSMIVRSDGSLWGAGYNAYNVLNNSSIHRSATFVRIDSANDWAQVACGGNHVIALKTDGSLWGWGYNSSGELGQGHTTNLTTPTRIGTANDWSKVSCGWQHVAAIKTDGTLWTWGYNFYGQLGKGTNTSSTAHYTPVKIGTATDWADIACGYYHTLGLRGSSLYTWGRNTQGQLAKGNITDSSSNYSPGLVTSGGGNWKKIISSVSANHALIINTSDQLYAWGGNDYGQVGVGSTSDNITSVTRVGTHLCKTAATGGYHSVFINMDGTAFVAGSNGYLQLAQPVTVSERTSPVQLDNRVWQMVGASHNGTFLIS